MNDQVLAALRSYIDALQRSVDMNEAFADHLVALAQVVGTQSGSPASIKPLLDQARRHRVDALKGRAKIASANQRFAWLDDSERT